jgi:hypothetical protein
VGVARADAQVVMTAQLLFRPVERACVPEVDGLRQHHDAVVGKRGNHGFADRLVSGINIPEIAAAEADDDGLAVNAAARHRHTEVSHPGAIDHTAPELGEQPFGDGQDEEVADVAIHWNVDERDVGSARNP